MALFWLVLILLAVDLAALLFGADTRPGLQHSSHRIVLHPSRRRAAASGWVVGRGSGRRANGG